MEPGLVLAKQVLSELSHTPTARCLFGSGYMTMVTRMGNNPKIVFVGAALSRGRKSTMRAKWAKKRRGNGMISLHEL